MKTRLASTIGASAAKDLYVESVRHLTNELKKLQGFEIFWAVNERHALGEWGSFDSLWQGQGDLGHKLSRVFSSLYTPESYVFIIGSDSPQISQRHFEQSICQLDHCDVVIGPAIDGGFYLIASKVELPESFWCGVPYSQTNTLEILVEQIEKLGFSYTLLEKLTDMDTVEDLHILKMQIANQETSLVNMIDAVIFDNFGH